MCFIHEVLRVRLCPLCQGALVTEQVPNLSDLPPGKRQKLKTQVWDFPGGAVVKNPPANAGDTGSSPGLGRSHVPRSN